MKRDIFDCKALHPAFRARLFTEIEPVVKKAFGCLIREGSIDGDANDFDDRWALWNRLINRNLAYLDWQQSFDYWREDVIETTQILPVPNGGISLLKRTAPKGEIADENDEVTRLGPDGWVRLPDGVRSPEPAPDNDPYDYYDYYDLDIEAIQAAALARCEAMGVGDAWQAEFESLPLAERRQMWDALTSGQQSALCDYWMRDPEIEGDFDEKPPDTWTGGEDDLPF